MTSASKKLKAHDTNRCTYWIIFDSRVRVKSFEKCKGLVASYRFSASPLPNNWRLEARPKNWDTRQLAARVVNKTQRGMKRDATRRGASRQRYSRAANEGAERLLGKGLLSARPSGSSGHTAYASSRQTASQMKATATGKSRPRATDIVESSRPLRIFLFSTIFHAAFVLINFGQFWRVRWISLEFWDFYHPFFLLFKVCYGQKGCCICR